MGHTLTAPDLTRLVWLFAALALFLGGCLEGLEGLDGGASCQPHFESSTTSCELACDASDVVLVQGSRYCTQECELDNTCPYGHVCVRFAPGDRPESACLVPCRTGADCPAGFLGICGPEGICGL